MKENKDSMDAAEKWAQNNNLVYDVSDYKVAFEDAITTDAAKEYWYAQFKAEQKESAVEVCAKSLKAIDSLTDEEINKAQVDYYEDKIEMLQRILADKPLFIALLIICHVQKNNYHKN
jgi:arsenate reductase-like glutaredoxin family protein